jgi:crossover junction endodeoxyribonuclease RuvC
MIILGIDPGINSVGYGLIKCNTYNNINYIESGLIKTSADDPLHIRLGIIVRRIEEIILEFNPQAIGMEEVFINKNALSSIKLCHARGAIMSVIGKKNTLFEEMSPTKVKKTLTGNGHADKMQILYMIKMVVKNVKDNITKDEGDALAVAYSLSIINSTLCLI